MSVTAFTYININPSRKSKLDEALKNLTQLRKGREKDNVEVLVYADHKSNGWNKLIEQLTNNSEQIEKAFDKTFSMPEVLHPEEKERSLTSFP